MKRKKTNNTDIPQENKKHCPQGPQAPLSTKERLRALTTYLITLQRNITDNLHVNHRPVGQHTLVAPQNTATMPTIADRSDNDVFWPPAPTQ